MVINLRQVSALAKSQVIGMELVCGFGRQNSVLPPWFIMGP